MTAGVHTLLWSYEKDTTDVPPIGSDAAWIDAVVLPLGSTGALQFTAATSSVSEAAGNAVVSVSRTGGSSGPASINFITSGVSATAGTDFTAQGGTLTWADGDSANKSITVPIIDDATYIVELSLATEL